MEELPHIPSDIIIDILPRLPVKSIIRFKSVSKSWCRVIEDPSLADRHLSRGNEEPGVLLAATPRFSSKTSYYLLGDDVWKAGLLCSAALFGESPYVSRLSLHGSCNGLVCLVALKEDYRLQVFICNVTLQEYITLPTDALQTMSRAGLCLKRYKLAYSPPTKEYKVLCYRDQVMRIHTLGTCSWRDVLSVPPHPFYGDPVFADGGLHWKADVEHCIISLDIGREEFYITNYPTLGSKRKWSIDLFEMRGCLVVADLSFLSSHIIDVWVLKDENNTNKKQWVKEYILKTKPVDKLFKLTCWGGHPAGSCATGFNFIGLWQQDKIFFECIDIYTEHKIYVYCDTKTDEMVPIMDLHFGGKSDFAIVREGDYLTRAVYLKRKSDFEIVGAPCGYTRSIVSLKPYGAF